VTRGEGRQLNAPGVEEPIGGHEEGIGAIASDACERRIDLAAGAGVKEMDFKPDYVRSRFHISRRRLGTRRIRRVNEHGKAGGCGHQLMQKPQLLGRQLCREEADACRVAARPSEAGNEANSHRVGRGREDDRSGRGGSLGRKCSRREGGSDYGHVALNKLCHQL